MSIDSFRFQLPSNVQLGVSELGVMGAKVGSQASEATPSSIGEVRILHLKGSSAADAKQRALDRVNTEITNLQKTINAAGSLKAPADIQLQAAGASIKMATLIQLRAAVSKLNEVQVPSWGQRIINFFKNLFSKTSTQPKVETKKQPTLFSTEEIKAKLETRNSLKAEEERLQKSRGELSPKIEGKETMVSEFETARERAEATKKEDLIDKKLHELISEYDGKPEYVKAQLGYKRPTFEEASKQVEYTEPKTTEQENAEGELKVLQDQATLIDQKLQKLRSIENSIRGSEKTPGNTSLLHQACMAGDLEIIESVLEACKGLCVNNPLLSLRDQNGIPPIGYIKDPKLARELLEPKASK